MDKQACDRPWSLYPWKRDGFVRESRDVCEQETIWTSKFATGPGACIHRREMVLYVKAEACACRQKESAVDKYT